MTWLCVNKDGTESICDGYFPKRNHSFWESYISIELPKGSIEKLIGKILTWESEPVEI